MRFSVVLSGFFAVLAAAEGTATSKAPTAVGLTPAQQSEQACMKACAAGDVDCQAHCVAVCCTLFALPRSSPSLLVARGEMAL